MRARLACIVGALIAATAAAAPAVHMPLRRVLTTAQPMEDVPVYGAFRELAYFYADVYIGTPPQKATVIVDTGSTLLAIPCKGCNGCGTHMNPWYDASKSSTGKSVTCSSCAFICSSNHCSYSQSYTEGSHIAGTVVMDKLWPGSENPTDQERAEAIDFQFGCHTSEGGLFRSQRADGIMGMGQHSRGGSFISALWRAHKLEADIFSLCFKLEGGRMVLGGMDTRLHTSEVQWTRMSSARFYKVQLRTLSMGGDKVSTTTRFNSGGGAIIDSGTSFTYLPSSAMSALKSKLAAKCSAADACLGTKTTVSQESICYKLSSPSKLATFPTLEFEFDGGATIVVQPEHYMFDMAWTPPATYCLGIYDNGNSNAMIGANTMMGHDVIFDMEHNRAGFAVSTCAEPAGAVGAATSPAAAASPSGAPPAASSPPPVAESASASKTAPSASHAAPSASHVAPSASHAAPSAAACPPTNCTCPAFDPERVQKDAHPSGSSGSFGPGLLVGGTIALGVIALAAGTCYCCGMERVRMCCCDLQFKRSTAHAPLREAPTHRSSYRDESDSDGDEDASDAESDASGDEGAHAGSVRVDVSDVEGRDD